MADKHAKLTVGGQDHALPVMEGTTGPDVVDIRKFYGETEREANYIFGLTQPDPTVAWSDLETLRPLGKDGKSRFRAAVRQARAGRRAAESEFRDTPVAKRGRIPGRTENPRLERIDLRA